MQGTTKNRDDSVVHGFGEEWARFPQNVLADSELQAVFDAYFAIFPWETLPCRAVGADIGCGSGRWAAVVAPKVGRLICLDASADALGVARRNLAAQDNVTFQRADVGELPIAEGQLDFVYSLGVLHHVPDTARAIVDIARILKPGGIFLLYLYYAFDNRPLWFRLLWKASDWLRCRISRLPSLFRFFVCDLIAVLVYWPVARFGALLDGMGITLRHYPLWFYRDKSFYVMRTDSLDRFGTRLEQRFTKHQIIAMLEAAGFSNIIFSSRAPFWCAVACKCQQ